MSSTVLGAGVATGNRTTNLAQGEMEHNQINRDMCVYFLLWGKIKQGKVNERQEAAVRVIREDFLEVVT